MTVKNHLKSAKYGLTHAFRPQLAPLTLAIGGVLSAGWAQAETITVTSLNSGLSTPSTNDCTLRSALHTASGSQQGTCSSISGDKVTIEFGSLSGTIYERSLAVSSPESVTIDGNEQITIVGDGTAPILFVASSVDELILDGLTITGGHAESQGGGVTSLVNHLEVRNSVITGNHGEQGGGLFHQTSDSPGSVLIYNSQFNYNSATYAGGGLVVSIPSGPIEIYHSEFTGNESNGYGGGGMAIVTNDTNALSIKHNTIADNYVENAGGGLFANVSNVQGDIAYNSFQNNTAEKTGGGVAIIAEASDIGLGGNDLEENHAESGGGIIAVLENTGLTATELNLESNTSSDDGAGMFIYADSASALEFEQATVLGNTAEGCGGGLGVTGKLAALDITYSAFVNNESGCGGAIYIGMTDIDAFEGVIEHSEISGNTANGQGGGIFSGLYGDPDSRLSIRNSTLSGNAGTYGGGVMMGGDAQLEIKYATFQDNSASVEGGGIMHVSSAYNCFVHNSVFQNYRGSTPEDIYSSYPESCNLTYSLLAGAQSSNFNDMGGNILDEDPELGPLSDHGGIGGRTHRPQESSPVIGAGQTGNAVSDHDQRGEGFARQVGDGIDMGAYESQILIDAIFSDRFEGEDDEDPGNPDD